MEIRIHPHAQERMAERGTSNEDIIETITGGEKFPAKFGRVGFRRNFIFGGEWKGRRYLTKQVEVYAIEDRGWLVITVIVKYF